MLEKTSYWYFFLGFVSFIFMENSFWASQELEYKKASLIRKVNLNKKKKSF